MEEKRLRVLIAGGGTGGHIFPAVSIAKGFIQHNADVLYVGNSNSMEEEVCFKNMLNFSAIEVQKFYRELTFKHLKFPFKLAKSIIQSIKIIKEFKPDLFIGTGGYVSGPVGYAAKLMKIPIYIQEQNSFPGKTTKILGKYARRIFLGFDAAKKYFNPNKTILSGNPINFNIINTENEINYNSFGMHSTNFKVFLLGGSQGSVALNNAFKEIVKELLAQNIEIFWQIGKRNIADIDLELKTLPGLYAFDFSDKIGEIYNSCDLVIARAGAITLAELETLRLPSILIPLPSAAENHQYYNAKDMVEKKVAQLIEEKDLTPYGLMNKIMLSKNNIEYYKGNFKDNRHLGAVKTIINAIFNDFD